MYIFTCSCESYHLIEIIKAKAQVEKSILIIKILFFSFQKQLNKVKDFNITKKSICLQLVLVTDI